MSDVGDILSANATDRLRQYSRQVEELGDDVGEVADEVDDERFHESGVVGETCGRRADQTAHETDQTGTEKYHGERDDALDDVHRHDVLHPDHAEFLEHPVQHLRRDAIYCTVAHFYNTPQVLRYHGKFGLSIGQTVGS